MTKTGPWNHGDRQLLLGDAAHSVVPFYGQGANAAFEDCLCLCEALDACNGDLATAVPRFAESRKPQTDALAQLSLENYIEMRHKTAVKAWLVRRKVDGLLSALLPRSWVPLYSMVAFTRIPYDAALERSRRQERVLDWLMYGGAAAVGGAAVAAAAKLLPRLLEGAGAGGLLSALAGRARR
jgi:kynurenine 3-monooxygenase